MSPGAPRFSSFRCSGEQSRKDKGPGCCPKPPQSATPYVHTPLAAITLFGEEPLIIKVPTRVQAVAIEYDSGSKGTIDIPPETLVVRRAVISSDVPALVHGGSGCCERGL